MPVQTTPWYLRPISRWGIFRATPISRFWVLLLAGFLLFSTNGFYIDLMSKGTKPYAVVYLIAVYSGLNACLWLVAVSRLPALAVGALIALQFFNTRIVNAIVSWAATEFVLRPVPSDTGIRFAATSMFCASILSYILFIRYIRREGKHSIRLQNELQLAHDMQKTLVPPLQLRTQCFEIYGISHPSERVGGDLVDTILLPNGDAIAYLADISGHGLPASILMGRLKTAARTALLDATDQAPDRTLPLLLDRLNTVLPQVKEPHLYATFSGFRFGSDGTAFCAMAGSPPILQWHADGQTVSHIQEPQLPIGLLPATSFDGYALHAAPGDLFVIATDGILEIANRKEEEFGIERLKQIVATNSQAPLPHLAETILTKARAFGVQFDDETMLLVRRL